MFTNKTKDLKIGTLTSFASCSGFLTLERHKTNLDALELSREEVLQLRDYLNTLTQKEILDIASEIDSK